MPILNAETMELSASIKALCFVSSWFATLNFCGAYERQKKASQRIQL